MKEAEKNRGIITAATGLFCNVLLSVAKILIGAFSHSVAIVADGVNSFTDAGSCVINVVGFGFSKKPADREHPYGHARYEYISAFIIALVMTVFSVGLIATSVEKIVAKEKTDMGIAAFIVLAIGIAVKFGLFLFYRIQAKKLASLSLRASAIDSLGDCFSTFVVLAAAFVNRFSGVDIDGYAGIAVAVFIFCGGVKLIRETSSALVGRNPPAELVESLKKKILSYDGILGVHDVLIHDYGRGRNFVSADVEMDGNGSLFDAHELIDKVEWDFAKEGISLTLHPDPVDVCPETVAAATLVKGILWSIDERLTLHDFRINGGVMEFDLSAPYEMKISDEELEKRFREEAETLFKGKEMKINVDRV